MSCVPTSFSNPRVSDRGFTLIEVLVVVALLGTLAAFAVPSLQLYLERSRLRAYSNELMASLQYAKSEALARNGNVRICPNLGDPKSVTCTSPYIKTKGSYVACTPQPYFDDGWKITTSTEVIRAIKLPIPEGITACATGNTDTSKTIELDSLGRPSEPFVAVSILSGSLCRLIFLRQTGLVELRTEDQTVRGTGDSCRVKTAL